MGYKNLSSFWLLICTLYLSQISNISCKSIELIQDTNAANKSMKIIAGSNAVLGDFPSIVSIQKYGTHFCGGSVYTPRIIITAAHCVTEITTNEMVNDDVIVLAGDVLLTDSETPSRNIRGISRIIKHPGYNSEKTGFLNDIAIMELKEPFDISYYLKPIQLTNRYYEPRIGEICKIAGWGSVAKMKEGEDESSLTPSLYLQKANIKIISSGVCKEKYNEEFFIPQMLCAGETQTDACHGDSGGPLICNNILYGVVSSGSGCGDSDNPGVYTNLRIYRDWIDSVTGVPGL